MQPDLILVRMAEAKTGEFGMKLVLRSPYCGVSSSAMRFTVSKVEPPEASVAAMTAPSTIGALHTTTRPRRSSSSISMAISLFVSAPPRSTRIGHARRQTMLVSMAAMIAPTSVPRPPSGSPPRIGERHLVADHLPHHVGGAFGDFRGVGHDHDADVIMRPLPSGRGQGGDDRRDAAREARSRTRVHMTDRSVAEE